MPDAPARRKQSSPPTIATAIAITKDHAIYGRVRLNQMSELIELPDGGTIREFHQIDLARELQLAGLVKASKTLAWDAMLWLATEQAYDPLVEHVLALPEWDNTERLSTWLHVYAHADKNDYTAKVGRWFGVSMIARALKPSVKVDTCIVLQGRQGLGKSRLCEILGGPFFGRPAASEFGGRDHRNELQGLWLIEFADLGNLGRADQRRVKAFLSENKDRLTRKYEKQPTDKPRRSVFIVTENPDGAGWLDDPTGARRFWPVDCRAQIEQDKLSQDRDQLLAEALVAYRAGEQWWPDDSNLEERLMLEQAQEGLLVADPWHDDIEAFVNDPSNIRDGELVITGSSVLAHLGIEIERREQRPAKRVAQVLKKLGFVRRTRRVNGRNSKVFVIE